MSCNNFWGVGARAPTLAGPLRCRVCRGGCYATEVKFVCQGHRSRSTSREKKRFCLWLAGNFVPTCIFTVFILYDYVCIFVWLYMSNPASGSMSKGCLSMTFFLFFYISKCYKRCCKLSVYWSSFLLVVHFYFAANKLVYFAYLLFILKGEETNKN